MVCKTHYPNNLVFEIPNVSKDLLKKNPQLFEASKLLQNCNESGLVTRQEIVSMLPPLLADIQSNHSVFDMCAAPGSKTAQVLEFIRTRGDPTGFVLANDADSKRAYLLTH